MQIPGFVVVVLGLGGLLWASYFHSLWYGERLELTGGYSCTNAVTHYGQFEIPTGPCRAKSELRFRPQSNETKHILETGQSAENATEGAEASHEAAEAAHEGAEAAHEGAPSTLEKLAPAIAECFAVILCGYMAGRMGLIRPDEVTGLNKFVGNFVLPALVFLSLAKLNFSDVNWGFLLIIYGAKAIVFVVVVIVTCLASFPTSLGRAGLYGIFATQSNDFALGYPLVQALYAQAHPDFASYLYLAAPSSLMMLNPVGFLLMELHRARSGRGVKPGAPWWVTGQRVLTGIGTNPVVFMTFLGIVANGVFQQCLPNILEGILKVLGQAFSASALFMLGIQMVGKVKSMRGSAMLVPIILITVKCFLLPLIIRGLLVHFPPVSDHPRDFQEYGFLLGTFPTAPGVFVFATLYNIDVDMMSSALVACTFLATPFMLLSARMASLGMVNVTAYVASLRHFVLYTTSVGAATLSCVICVILMTRKYRRVPYHVTTHLLVAQLLAAVGALLWYSLEDTVPWQLYLKYITFTLGQFAGRVWAALLAVTLTLVSRHTVGVVRRLQTVSCCIGWGLPVLLTAVIFAGSDYEGYEVANATISEFNVAMSELDAIPVYVKTNPNMGFGVLQIYTNFFVQLICLLVVVICLSLHHRYKHQYVTYVSINDGETSSAATTPTRPGSLAGSRAPSLRRRNPSGGSEVSVTPSLGSEVSSAPSSAPSTASEMEGSVSMQSDAAGEASAPPRRARARPPPFLKTRSQMQLERAYVEEAQRKTSAPEMAASALERPALTKRSKSLAERKLSAREQLTYSFAPTPAVGVGGDNWKMMDPRAPVPPAAASAPAGRTERSFSVQKLTKRESEQSMGSVIRCDATGCQLRKKITAAPKLSHESSMDDDTMSVASGETDLSGFSHVSSSSTVSFASRAPSVATSLYNPEMAAVDTTEVCPDKCSLTSADDSSVLRDRDEEFHTLRHTLLLVSLSWSMVVSMFLCGCSLPVQRLGRMGGVYIQLTFIDTVINFGQGLLAFLVLGLDPEAFLMPFRNSWMSLRYGSTSVCLRLSRRATLTRDDTEHVCQKFIDFYLEKCTSELVRDRRVQQKLLHDVFLGTELVDWLILQGLAGSRRAAVHHGRKLFNGGILEPADSEYHLHDMPFWYRLTAPYRDQPKGDEPHAKISRGKPAKLRPSQAMLTHSETIVDVD